MQAVVNKGRGGVSGCERNSLISHKAEPAAPALLLLPESEKLGCVQNQAM